MTGRYALSPLAQGDLDQIWDYTETRWGRGQAETYLRRIRRHIEAVAAQPALGRTRSDVRVGYRSYPSDAHVLFYRLTPDGIDVVRILHRRMDFFRHL